MWRNSGETANRASATETAAEITHHAGSDSYRTTFGIGRRRVTDAVLSVVAHASGRDPVELPVLYRAVDPDALESIFDQPGAGTGRCDASIEFEYAQHRVRVEGRGTVTARPLSSPP